MIQFLKTGQKKYKSGLIKNLNAVKKFAGKYRIGSHRLSRWNYANEAAYYITIVTQNRHCVLGQIENKKMVLSDFGKIVKTEWLKSFDIRQELFLDEYVIMPNHLHAIVILRNMDDERLQNFGSTKHITPDNRDVKKEMNGAGHDATNRLGHDVTNGMGHDDDGLDTDGRPYLNHHHQQQHHHHRQQPPYLIRQPKSISSFMAGFKSAVNSKIDDFIDQNNLNIPKYNRDNHFFQPNYYDRIIRNPYELMRIRNYIIDNPKNWKGGGMNHL